MKKLEIGVCTSVWYEDEHLEESLRFIRDCGFEAIDFSFDRLYNSTLDKEKLTSFYDRSREEREAYFRRVKEAVEKYGLHISQGHGLFPIYVPGDERGNAYRTQVTNTMIEACSYLGCKYLVVHPWAGGKMTAEEQFRINRDIYRGLMDTARRCGVTICLENLYFICDNARETCQYIDDLNQDAGAELFGFCFDVAHANLMINNLYQYITLLGDRLKVLHIHDNDGTNDTHMLPFTQVKNVRKLALDWEGLIKGLRDAHFEGCLSFETVFGLEVLPPEMRPAGLRFVFAAGEYLRKRITEE